LLTPNDEVAVERRRRSAIAWNGRSMARAALVLVVLLAACSSSGHPALLDPPTTTASALLATPAPSTTTTTSTTSTPPVRDLPVTTRAVGASITVWQPAAGDGPWPLIVFAHGYNTTPQTYARLLRVWAAAGYVVAATASNEPDAIVAGITTMSRDAAVDASRIAVAGHSDGATRAVDVAFDPAIHDERVRAVVALVSDPLDCCTTLSGPPLLLEQGDADTTSPKHNGDALYAQVRSPKWYLVLKGAEHAPPIVRDTPWTPIVDETTLAFLDRYVAERATDDAALGAAAAASPSLATLTAG
jgi:poly(3-hydroxybutyrate) depolymerase